MSRGRPRWGRRALVSLALLFLGFVLFEAVLRVAFPATRFLDERRDCYWASRLAERASSDGGLTYGRARIDDRLGWTPVPNRSGSVSTNAEGFRGTREYSREKPAGGKRIVALGDSFTFGFGVRDEETYCSRMEQAQPDLEVVNLAANGYGTDQQFLRWRETGIGYAPDAVLLGFYVPDFDRNTLSVRELPKPRFVVLEGKLRLESSRVPSVEEVQRAHTGCAGRSRIVGLARGLARRYDTSGAEAEFRTKAELLSTILRELAASVEAANAELLVVILPHRNASTYPLHARIEGVVETAASELGLPVLNLTTRCQEWAEAEGVYAEDGHWSARGHELASLEIQAFLQANGVL